MSACSVYWQQELYLSLTNVWGVDVKPGGQIVQAYMYARTLTYFTANILLKGLDTVFGCRTVGVLITNWGKTDQKTNTLVVMYW